MVCFNSPLFSEDIDISPKASPRHKKRNLLIVALFLDHVTRRQKPLLSLEYENQPHNEYNDINRNMNTNSMTYVKSQNNNNNDDSNRTNWINVNKRNFILLKKYNYIQLQLVCPIYILINWYTISTQTVIFGRLHRIRVCIPKQVFRLSFTELFPYSRISVFSCLVLGWDPLL